MVYRVGDSLREDDGLGNPGTVGELGPSEPGKAVRLVTYQR